MDDQHQQRYMQHSSMAGMQHPTGYGMQALDGVEDGSRKQEIGDILQQIMNITDQSLDEAQAR